MNRLPKALSVPCLSRPGERCWHDACWAAHRLASYEVPYPVSPADKKWWQGCAVSGRAFEALEAERSRPGQPIPALVQAYQRRSGS